MSASTPLCTRNLRRPLFVLLFVGLCTVSVVDSLAQADTQEVIKRLIEQMGDESELVRHAAAVALGDIGPEAAEAVEPLIEAMGDEDEYVREAAVWALGDIGPEAVEPLIEALGDENEQVREQAAVALGRIGPEAAPAIEPLIEALRDESEGVRDAAGWALLRIAELQYREGNTRQLALFEEAYAIIDENRLLRADQRSEFGWVLRALQDRRSLEEERLINQANAWVRAHPLISLIALFYVGLLTLCLVVLWLRPLGLLTINQKLEAVEGHLSIEIGGLTLVFPLRYPLVVGFFHYQRRVLDAWVKCYLDTARESFENLPTVSERAVHVPLPTKIKGTLTDEDFSPTHMRPVFSKNIACVLIRGEGGSGKTSLACQMGLWAMRADPEARLAPSHSMLPVLVEEDFDNFLDAVNARLQSLIDETEPVAEDLLLRLLRQRRVLVIVDHLSELSERTREAFRPGASDFAANALIITSRTSIDTGRPHMLVEPLRIEADLLFEFMGAYLRRRGYRQEFKDAVFGPMVSGLSAMVGERDVTVLLAKLYAEQMIAVKVGEAKDLPESIPDLMLRYVNWLNRKAGPDDPGNSRVQRLAKPLAWKCLQATYRPGPVKRDDVQDILEGADEGEDILDYFNNKLRLIQPVGPAADRFQFSLDPLAEYLAALHVVEKKGDNEKDWQRFIEESASKEGAPEAVRGFVLAVRDCCIHSIYGQEVPDFVPDELARHAGLDPEAEERLRREQRVRRLIGELSRPLMEEREHAAEALGRIGLEAAPAAEPLIEALRDKNERVREQAAWALGEIGPEAVEPLIEAMGDESERVRETADWALKRINADSDADAPA